MVGEFAVPSCGGLQANTNVAVGQTSPRTDVWKALRVTDRGTRGIGPGVGLGA